MANSAAAIVRANLENELSWRQNEIRSLRNLQGNVNSVRTGNEARRRALLVMLYSHLEGFVRFALEQYADSINAAKVAVGKAQPQLAAACLSEKFREYRSSETADPYDPSATRARQVLRDADLLEQMLQLQSGRLEIPVQVVTSAESNLTPTVLRRNLALLALEEADILKFVSSLNGLLRLRK